VKQVPLVQPELLEKPEHQDRLVQLVRQVEPDLPAPQDQRGVQVLQVQLELVVQPELRVQRDLPAPQDQRGVQEH
jgi:hypothetical protein